MQSHVFCVFFKKTKSEKLKKRGNETFIISIIHSVIIAVSL